MYGDFTFLCSISKNSSPRIMNSNLAKQLVCLDECKKLHELGALNENLPPYLEQNSWTDVTGIDKEYSSGAGRHKKEGTSWDGQCSCFIRNLGSQTRYHHFKCK